MAGELNGDMVRRLRLAKGWTQDHLAQLIERTARTVQRVERDGTCDLETRSALAAVLKVSASELDREPALTMPEYEPSSAVPMSRATLFAYLNGHRRPIELLRNLASRRGLKTRPVDPESAYLNEQVNTLKVKTVRELDDILVRHWPLADKLSDYMQPEGAIDTGFIISLVLDIETIEARGLEGFVAYREGLRFSTGGRRWAEEIFGYYTNLKAYP